MSQTTIYAPGEIPLVFDTPIRFATPAIHPLPQPPSTFKRGRRRRSITRNMDTNLARSSLPSTSDQTRGACSADAASASQQLITGDPPLTGRELRPRTFPNSNPTDDNQPARESPAKKSHARKQPEGHIPRPRNAFILFRCDFVAQKKVPASVETDHRNISRIVGRIWKAMSDEDRRPWVEKAKRERERHKRLYPQYRYSPSSAATAAATMALKAKRARNQKIGESVGVLRALEDTSHNGSCVPSSSCQQTQEQQPREVPQAEMQLQTQVSASDAPWSTPTTQHCGSSIASHILSGDLSFAHPGSWTPPSELEQNWSLASDTKLHQCSPQGLNTSSPSQQTMSLEIPAASSHFDSPDPSPVRLTEILPPFMFIASHHMTNNPESSEFSPCFSPAPGDVSALDPSFTDPLACGNDITSQYQPYLHDLNINLESLFEGPAWTTDQIDDIIRNMQSESLSTSQQPNSSMNL